MPLVTPVLSRDVLEWLPIGTIASPSREFMDDPKWAADDAMYRTLAVHSLAACVDYLWPALHPGRPLQRGPHFDVICFGLEQLAYGRVEGNELLLNIPPRCLKSETVGVFFPAWIWLHSPWASIMGISGAEEVALRDNRAMRKVIDSPRYRRLRTTAIEVLGEHGLGPGEEWELTKDQNQKKRFENTLGGQRFALAAGAKITGEGGDLQIVDDPIDAKEALEGTPEQVATRLAQVIQRYDMVWSTRLQDPGRSPRVTIMQRLSEMDLAGYLLAKGTPSIVLPMEFEKDHPHRSPLDWRTEEGELLIPNHYTPTAVDKMKDNLKEYGYAAQGQQRPSPAAGGMFPDELWGYYDEPPTMKAREIYEKGGRIYISFDCAAKTGANNSFTVGLVVGVLAQELYVLGMYRDRVELPGLEDMYRTARSQWPLHYQILVEDASSGTSLIQLKIGDGNVIPYSPQAHGGKETRAGFTQTFHRAGRILLPKGRPLTPLLMHEHKMFPRGAYADIVDALAQVAMHVRLEAAEKGQERSGDRWAWMRGLLGDSASPFAALD